MLKSINYRGIQKEKYLENFMSKLSKENSDFEKTNEIRCLIISRKLSEEFLFELLDKYSKYINFWYILFYQDFSEEFLLKMIDRFKKDIDDFNVVFSIKKLSGDTILTILNKCGDKECSNIDIPFLIARQNIKSERLIVKIVNIIIEKRGYTSIKNL